MPIYEYECTVPGCGLVIEELRKISEMDDPVKLPHGDPQCPDGQGGDCGGCKFRRILSPTPTTFRFNDFTGYGGLEKTRKMHGPVRRKKDPF